MPKRKVKTIPKNSITIILKYKSLEDLQESFNSKEHDTLMGIISKFASKTNARFEVSTNL
nr:MAG: hypothetical protein [uncultured archaeon]